ncbi:MAG: helix-turn-helix domain-containing protein [Rivularia sp. (in: cyanobacteria)]
MVDSQEFYLEVGNRVRQARQKIGMSQEALASLVSLTRTSVTNIEKGRQKFLVHTLMDLASALQVEPETLLPNKQDNLETELDDLLKNHSLEEQDWVKAVVTSVEDK